MTKSRVAVNTVNKIVWQFKGERELLILTEEGREDCLEEVACELSFERLVGFNQQEWGERDENVILTQYYFYLCLLSKTNFKSDTSILLNTGGFPGGSTVKNPPAVQEIQETRVQFLG